MTVVDAVSVNFLASNSDFKLAEGDSVVHVIKKELNSYKLFM